MVPGSPRLDPIATGRSDRAGEAPTLYNIDGIRFEQCDSLGRTPRWVRSWRYSAASVIADRSVGEVQMRKALLVFGTVLGVYLIARAIAEPFVIDVSDPASYRKDWGGPGLAGVLRAGRDRRRAAGSSRSRRPEPRPARCRPGRCRAVRAGCKTPAATSPLVDGPERSTGPATAAAKARSWQHAWRPDGP